MRTLFDFAVAHPDTAAAVVAAFLIALWKRLPPEARAAVEARSPRLVNAIRVLYSLFPDVVKAYAAARAVAKGAPKPPPPVALDERAGEVLR